MPCIKRFAPASIGNVSVGFDLLGLAILPLDSTPLGDTVTVSKSTSGKHKLSQDGPFVDQLPSDPADNLVIKAAHLFGKRYPQAQQGLDLHLHKGLPVGSGLGSSAASAVCALAAINAFHHDPIPAQTLMQWMGELEADISGSWHLDNVAPSYLGGLVISPPNPEQPVMQIPTPDEWYWSVCYPGTQLATAKARKVLPETVPMHTAIAASGNLARFVAALHQSRDAVAIENLVDVLAEPHRKSLLPGFETTRLAAREAGACAFGISGAGPTVFALSTDRNTAQSVTRAIQNTYQQTSRGFAATCITAPLGAISNEDT